MRPPKGESLLSSNRDLMILQQLVALRIQYFVKIVSSKHNNSRRAWDKPRETGACGNSFKIQLAGSVIAKNGTRGGYFPDEPAGDRRTPRGPHIGGEKKITPRPVRRKIDIVRIKCGGVPENVETGLSL